MSHITESQRYTIEVLLKKGLSKTEIAKTIGKHKSSISREIKRNSDARNGAYRSSLANSKAKNRHKVKPKHKRLTRQMEQFVNKYIRQEYSPEQIVGFAKDQSLPCVSHETIYQHIWNNKHNKGDLYLYLRRKGRKYRHRGSSKDTRGIIKARVKIDQRPKIVDLKKRFGDLEIDTVIGQNHQQAIVTINDRASGMLKMKKVEIKDAESVARVTTYLLTDWIPYLHTITSDNGKEFANHQQIADSLMIDFYFANPYHSWERGANENLNGLIRQYFPKKTDFSKITEQQIKEVETKLNNRPRKRHQYKTPIFVMEKLLFNSEVAFMG
jgi:transposase, IS30 family